MNNHKMGFDGFMTIFMGFIGPLLVVIGVFTMLILEALGVI